MLSTVTKKLLAVLLFAVIGNSADAAPSNRPPRFLQEPVLGLRLELTGLKLDPLPENVRAMCGQVADDDTWTGRVWIVAEAKDAAATYYVLAGYFKRRNPGPGESLYDTDSQGGVYTIKGSKCGGDPAREVFDTRDFNETPQPVLQQLANDLAIRLIKAMGGADRLRAELKGQRIDFNQLSPELQVAFKPYFGQMK
ncbi:hypothetical protein [Massilia sp. Bi118]|uniref:hypothetical protein n=1 Tax=Massilia sp. Bi118 TaxID=2822346 RepID=UPI001E33DD46|nr:hypothetical protein [Massilia sp. Bi118]